MSRNDEVMKTECLATKSNIISFPSSNSWLQDLLLLKRVRARKILKFWEENECSCWVISIIISYLIKIMMWKWGVISSHSQLFYIVSFQSKMSECKERVYFLVIPTTRLVDLECGKLKQWSQLNLLSRWNKTNKKWNLDF